MEYKEKNMKFSEAFKAMKDGKKIKLPSWGGYWSWDEEKQTIMMHCRPQDSDAQEEILDIRQTERVEYTTMNICSDEWIIADETNTTILGGTPTFNFGEAIKYMKRGMKVARKGWNGKGMYVFKAPKMGCQMFEQYTGKSINDINEFFVIKNVNGSLSTWVPSINDCLAEDWVFTD